MRISDWSSDVCSSDLSQARAADDLLFGAAVVDQVLSGDQRQAAAAQTEAAVLDPAAVARHQAQDPVRTGSRPDARGDDWRRAARAAHHRLVPPADRKSTRLNSSH